MPALFVPETVNLHITASCNQKCLYCFGHFPSLRDAISLDAWLCIIEKLAAAGVKRVNFSGGEPTCHPGLGTMLRKARSLGLKTSVVSNGWRLTDEIIEWCDGVALSIDSAKDEINAALGRCSFLSYLANIEDAARRVRAAGRYLKINTVVTLLNVDEDLRPLYRRLMPNKVKLLQFTRVEGENDGIAPELFVSRERFEEFVTLHKGLETETTPIRIQEEADAAIRKSYVMVNPAGCVFQHAPEGGHRSSRPILEVGFPAALQEAGGYDREEFLRRGGDIELTSSRPMRSEIDVPQLYEALRHPYEVAREIVRVSCRDEEALSAAARQWVSNRNIIGRDRCFRTTEEHRKAVVRLLESLGGSSRFRLLVALAAEPERSVASEGPRCPSVLDLAVAVAPAREQERLPRHVVYSWIACAHGAGKESDAYVHDLSIRLAEHDAELAYELLQLSAEQAKERLLDEHLRIEPLLHVLRGKLEAAEDALRALALRRHAVEGAKRVPEDDSWLSQVDAERLLRSDRLFAVAKQLAGGRQDLPPVVKEAIRFVETSPDDTLRARAMVLLARTDRKHEVPKLIACATPPINLRVFQDHAKGIFTDDGWGGRNAQKLIPLARLLLQDGTWPHEFWAVVLLREQGDKGDDWVDKRSRQIMAEALMDLARDAQRTLEQRRRAVDALGMLGFGDAARWLGKLKAPELAESIKVAQRRLSKTAKGHEVPADVGIKLALNACCGRNR